MNAFRRILDWPPLRTTTFPSRYGTQRPSPMPPAASHRRQFAMSGVEIDSRDVQPGDLFFALKGEAMDGHRFVDMALAKGAVGRRDRPGDCRAACAGRRHHRRADRAGPGRARTQPGGDHRRDRLGRQDRGQGSDFRRARPRQPRGGAPLGEELQQPCRRAAQPCADAGAQPLWHFRDGHEPRRRDRRADPAWCARISR